MGKLYLRLGVATGLLLLSQLVWSLAGANPQSFWIQQANGDRFELLQKGHRLLHWQETLGGQPVVLHQGQWYLARLSPDNKLVSTGQLLSSTALAGLQKPSATSGVPTYKGPLPAYQQSLSQKAPVQVRNQSLLVVLVDFSDIQISASLDELSQRFFGDSDSVASYFKDTSYSRLTLVPAEETDGVSDDGFVRLTLTSAHPDPGADDARSLAKNLLEMTAAVVNFGLFDDAVSGRGNGDSRLSAKELSVVFVLAGYEASFSGAPPVPNVWGHVDYFAQDDIPVVDGMEVGAFTMFGERHGSSFQYHTVTKGIVCHELGHLMLGLPDLYDRVGSTEGNGEWSLMSGGSWNNLTGADAGSSPAQLLGWSKARAGFVGIQDLDAAQSISLENASVSEDIKRLWIDPYRHFEYFLLENRQKVGLDVAIPGSGLLITHVDERRIDAVNDDPKHKLVDIEEAHNGILNSISTPFGGGGEFNNETLPGSRGYDGVASGIVVNNVSASTDSPMTMDVAPQVLNGRSQGYYKEGVFASVLAANSLWAGTRVTNSTGVNNFDGLDLYAFDAAQIDVHISATLSDAMISNWLYSQLDFVVSPGWNRLLLDERQYFPAAEERFIVVNVKGAGSVSLAQDVDNESAANSYIGAIPGALSINSAELSQQFLFSGDQRSSSNIPLITGHDVIEMNEDATLLLDVSLINVVDADNLPGDFVLTVLGGPDYQVQNNQVTPALNFNGELSVSVRVTDGVNASASFNLLVVVNPVNDAPMITGIKSGVTYSVIQGQSVAVFKSDLDILDPESDPVLQLTLLPGEGYNVVSNVITTHSDFSGQLLVPVVVSDGEATSSSFLLPVQVVERVVEPVAEDEGPAVNKGGDSSTGSVFWMIWVGFCLYFYRLKRSN